MILLLCWFANIFVTGVWHDGVADSGMCWGAPFQGVRVRGRANRGVPGQRKVGAAHLSGKFLLCFVQ